MKFAKTSQEVVDFLNDLLKIDPIAILCFILVLVITCMILSTVAFPKQETCFLTLTNETPDTIISLSITSQDYDSGMIVLEPGQNKTIELKPGSYTAIILIEDMKTGELRYLGHQNIVLSKNVSWQFSAL